MDRCEELAAAYGQSPRDVLRWPWVQVEEWWRSYMKRRDRRFKEEAIMRGADPMEAVVSGASAATSAAPALKGGEMKIGETPSFLYSEWNAAGTPVRHNRSTYEAKARAVTERPPTDSDDWDIPPAEVFKLAALFPGAVKSVQT